MNLFLPAHTLEKKHLLSISDLSVPEIEGIFQTADSFLDLSSRSVRKVPGVDDLDDLGYPHSGENQQEQDHERYVDSQPS